MKVAYASRTGNVEKVVTEKLGLTDAIKIADGTERIDGEYVIFTYTTGHGETPEAVERFLKANPGVRAVVSSGNRQYHADTFNFASDNIHREYGVPILAKLDGVGTEADHEAIRAGLAKL